MADCTNCQFKAEAERERAWHDRVLKSAQEIYGEDCVRYKLSLFKNGRAMNHFPRELDGHWFAFQRAEDDGHMGLVAMLEAQKDEIERLRGERDDLRHELDELRRQYDMRGGMLELTRMRRDELEADYDRLMAKHNALHINAARQRAELSELATTLGNLVGLARLGAARLDAYTAALEEADAMVKRVKAESLHQSTGTAS